MDPIRLVLDVTKGDANVLFDMATGKRMTFRKPLVIVPFISESMRISIANGSVIDVDGVTGIKVRPEHCRGHARLLELMKINKIEAPKEKPSTLKKNEEDVENTEAEPIEEPTEEPVEEKPKATRSKASKTATKEESE